MSTATLLSVSMMRLKPRMDLMRKTFGPVRFVVPGQTWPERFMGLATAILLAIFYAKPERLEAN
jgi:hypothetical protein